MPKILCLHGARSSSDVTKLQLFSLGLDALGCELDSIESPLVGKVAYDGSIADNSRSWQAVASDTEPGLFSADSSQHDSLVEQLQQSLNFVVAHVRSYGPYDGAYGFSQGASIVTLLSDKNVLRSLGVDEPLWDFVILACGVDYLAAQREELGSRKLELPSLHLIGLADPWREQSEVLLGRYERPRVLRHPYGHELPLTLKDQNPDLVGALAEYVLTPGLGKAPPETLRVRKSEAEHETDAEFANLALISVGVVAAVGLPLLLYELWRSLL